MTQIAPASRLTLDWTKAHDVCPLEMALSQMHTSLVNAKRALLDGSGPGAAFTGWLRFPEQQSLAVLKNIQSAVEAIQAHSNAIVVIGIGGSLLGTRAIYDALTHSFSALNPTEFHRRPLLFWAGHHLATDELTELIEALDQTSPSLIIVSKSGGTTEPALSFRVLKSYLETRYGSAEASGRIFAVTDPEDGTLLKIAKENKYPHFTIPKDVGGRYSLFTAVGLFPLAAAGIDVKSLIAGAKQAQEDCLSAKNDSLETNVALCYAGVRNALYAQGYKIESLCFWTPKLRGIAEWWKQLFGESDGKNNTGIFPASTQFTTDLHSMGQYFQEGERILFATHIKIADEYSQSRGAMKRKIRIPDANLDDGFNFLTGTNLDRIQDDAQLGTFLAHADGKVPTLFWEIPELNAYWLGYWAYTNMFACAVGGIARGINPFDQPGVEAYKLNMFALMNKPGFTEESTRIRARLERGNRLRSFGLSTKGN